MLSPQASLSVSVALGSPVIDLIYWREPMKLDGQKIAGGAAGRCIEVGERLGDLGGSVLEAVNVTLPC